MSIVKTKKPRIFILGCFELEYFLYFYFKTAPRTLWALCDPRYYPVSIAVIGMVDVKKSFFSLLV